MFKSRDGMLDDFENITLGKFNLDFNSELELLTKFKLGSV